MSESTLSIANARVPHSAPKTGERGASLVEYALLCSLIALVAIVGVGALGGGINAKFVDINTKLVAAK